MNKEILYTTKDRSLEIKLIYIVKNNFKKYYVGKSWPKHTQCLLFINGLLESHGTVIKHAFDEDNQRYAYILATRKALNSINIKFIRSEVWRLVHKEVRGGVLSDG